MSIADDLAAEFKPKRVKCQPRDWFETLEDADRKLLMMAIDNGAHAAGLYRVAKANNYIGSESQFRRHIKGLCGCER